MTPNYEKMAREIMKDTSRCDHCDDGPCDDCLEYSITLAIQKAVEDEREACAKEADKHGQEYSALADEFEKDPVEKFMSEATKSHIVSDMASVAQECICIATAIRSRGGK